MQIEFLGAAHEVTGSCHYVTFGDKHVLVDCGMEQGPDLYVNQEIPVNAAAVDYVFVTHAHIDHSGLLPLLYNHGFRGQIFPEIFRPCMQKAIRGRSMRQRQLVISAISCFVTAHISRCLRQNGETGKQNGPENRKWYQCTI